MTFVTTNSAAVTPLRRQEDRAAAMSMLSMAGTASTVASRAAGHFAFDVVNLGTTNQPQLRVRPISLTATYREITQDQAGRQHSVAHVSSPVTATISLVGAGLQTATAIDRFRNGQTISGSLHATAAVGHAVFAVAAAKGGMFTASKVGMTLALAGAVGGVFAANKNL